MGMWQGGRKGVAGAWGTVREERSKKVRFGGYNEYYTTPLKKEANLRIKTYL